MHTRNHKRFSALLALILLTIFSGCSGDSDSGPSLEVTNFTITQVGDKLRVSYTTNQPAQSVRLYMAQNGSSGQLFLYEAYASPFELPFDVFLNPGDTGFFFLEAMDSNYNPSEQFGPEPLTIAAYCSGPSNLQVNSGLVSWDAPTIANTYYQVQYGPEGFAIGNGTVYTTNSTSTDNVTFVAGQVYDVYVRGYCSTGQTFSNWVGPVTYFAGSNQNVCGAPTNIGWNIEYNFFGEAVGATFVWTDAGNNFDYEYNLVGNNLPPTTGAVESGSSSTVTYLQVPQNTEFDFYVRTKCVDGSFTNWVGPINVNIGN